MSEAIEVTVTQGPLAIDAEWRDLVSRAAPNVFLDPAGLNAILATGYATTHVLLAWERGYERKTLVGVWALEEQTVGKLGIRYLEGLPHKYAFVASPVIDLAHTDTVTAAFLAAIAADPKLPKVVHAKFLDGGVDSFHALATVAGARRRLTLSERQRAFLTRDSGAKRSGSTRKKMRQDWNRLAAQGAVDIVNDRNPAVAKAAFETFLTMEAQSWKGANGTALLSSADDARFVRALFANLADAGAATVALLRLDGTPIAAQVVLTSGAMAYTWKIAYVAAYEKFSPGVLLVDKLAEQLFAEGAIDAIESCSPQGGFMESLWSGRRRTVELLIEVGDRRTVAFTAVAAVVRGHAMLRDLYHRVKAWRGARRTGKVPAAA